MVISSKRKAKELSLGLYVKFEAAAERNSATVTSDGPFRKFVTVYMKEGMTSKKKLALLMEIITSILNGAHFPIRIDWENAKPYFSKEDFENLDRIFCDIPIYLYNAKELDHRKIDIDAIANSYRWSVEKARK